MKFNFIKIQNIFLLTVILFITQQASADIKVFACEPEWQSLVLELGGEKVTVFSATNGMQDPHQIQARPSLISKMRDAELLICSGADLETGWLPLLLRRASNSAVALNSNGYFMAADHVRLRGIPKNIDRSHGDVHAAGNPHVQTSPKNIQLIAKALVKRMKKIDPINADFYQKQTDDFLSRWKKSMQVWKQKLRAIKSSKIVAQHASWDYLLDFAKLEQIALIENNPGIPATSGQLAMLLANLKHQPAKLIIHAAYQNGRSSEWLSEHSGIKSVTLPFTVGGSDKAVDLFSLYDETFRILIEAINP
jgi:zinc/manganese transport system substrate-binding protein